MIRKTKGNGANELSKGALRALRAQARQSVTPSIDWSDASFSRANSLEAEANSFDAAYPDLANMAYEMPLGDMPYVGESDPYYSADATGDFGWGFGVTIGQGNQPVQQTYAYPTSQSVSLGGRAALTYRRCTIGRIHVPST